MQVEGERTEVLRLSAELDDVRSGAQEDAEAAKSREEALQALVASENEVRVHLSPAPSMLSCLRDCSGPVQG